MNEIRELTDMEVEAVSGGDGSPLINLPITIQNNFAVPPLWLSASAAPLALGT
jgi:hypothetical protein